MADTGWITPGTVINVDYIGGDAWTNPGNVIIDDASYAYANISKNDQSKYLRCTNFNLSLPSALIDGIEVRIDRWADVSGEFADHIVQLRDVSGTIGDNKAGTLQYWGTAPYSKYYGGSTDDWNAELTNVDVNNSAFGVDIVVDSDYGSTDTVYIEFVSIKVYYTEQSVSSESSSSDSSVSSESSESTYSADLIIEDIAAGESISSQSSSSSSDSSNSSSSNSSSSSSAEKGCHVYGHDTAVEEPIVKDFTGNWTTTADIVGIGDNERLEFVKGDTKQSPSDYVGSGQREIILGKYQPGKGTVDIEYRTGTTKVACDAAGWTAYTGEFTSSGWVGVRLVSPSESSSSDSSSSLSSNSSNSSSSNDSPSSTSSSSDSSQSSSSDSSQSSSSDSSTSSSSDSSNSSQSSNSSDSSDSSESSSSIDLPWLSGWGFRKEITIQDTNVDGDLADFPLQVILDADGDFHESRADGYDIRFTEGDGETLLKYERQAWSGGDGSAATAIFWVKIPSILATGGATIYIYYGKSDASDEQDAANTWEDGYLTVLHLTEDGDGTSNEFVDSSGNNNHFTGGGGSNQPTPVDVSSAHFGIAQDFNLTDRTFISRADYLGEPAIMTMSCWVKLDLKDTNGADVFGFGDVGGTFRLDNPTSYYHAFFKDTTTWRMTLDASAQMYVGDGWLHCIFQNDPAGSHQGLWLNGVEVGTATWGDPIDYAGSGSTFIGRHGNGDDKYDLEGQLNEVRVCDCLREDEWLKFEYHNIANGELSWEAEE